MSQVMKSVFLLLVLYIPTFDSRKTSDGTDTHLHNDVHNRDGMPPFHHRDRGSCAGQPPHGAIQTHRPTRSISVDSLGTNIQAVALSQDASRGALTGFHSPEPVVPILLTTVATAVACYRLGSVPLTALTAPKPH